MDINTLVFELDQKSLENSLEFVGAPVEVLHFHDEDGLEGVDSLLPELPLFGVDSDSKIDLEKFIKGLVGFDIGHETVMGRFTYLWLLVA